MNHQALSSFIWSVADLLRGDYKQSEYGRVILPFTVLRRLDCVLEATKPAVLTEFQAKTKAGLNPDPFLIRKAGQSFFNSSPLDLVKLLGDQDHIRQNQYAYVQAFSPAARDIFERFDFYTQVESLAKAGLLFAMGDFKDVLTDIVIEGQEAHNSIAAQLLKDERVFAAMQGMLAKMVWQQFQAGSK
jgi:type I restriction enzyme M protein